MTFCDFARFLEEHEKVKDLKQNDIFLKRRKTAWKYRDTLWTIIDAVRLRKTESPVNIHTCAEIPCMEKSILGMGFHGPCLPKETENTEKP